MPPVRTSPLLRFPLAALLSCLTLTVGPSSQAETLPAESSPAESLPAATLSAARIYQQKCASCHGADGGGVEDHYEGPLYGDGTIDQLARRIAETMPEDDPDSCVGDEARAVAEFIYGEFYSQQARLAKGLISAPRVELARLTVPQYRHAVADLIGTFTPRPWIQYRDVQGSEGLRAEYYQSRNMNQIKQRALVRLDRQIEFDFGTGAPAAGMRSDQFSILWQGSLLAPETGDYEFRIHSPNGVRLFLNTDFDPTRRDNGFQPTQPQLIDAWVSSGKMRTSRGRVFLLGGRQYPIRIEFFKYKDDVASIHLEWKPPHAVWSTLRGDSLSPTLTRRTFVCETPFPPDDRSLGYERGSSVSPEWHSAVTSAALAAAEEVIQRLPLLTGVKKKDLEQATAASSKFLAQFASTAFRRPLTDQERKLFRETLFQNSGAEMALRRGVLLTLTSPHFLYTNLANRDERPPATTIAARLAFALWDSLPDAELRRVARLGRLTSRAQIEAQADRMLDDPRTRAKLQGFFRHWLELEERDLSKDQQMYPDFDEAVIADLRRSLELFVDRVVWSQTSDYRQLLQADYLLLNDRLGKLYADSANMGQAVDLSSEVFVRVDDETHRRSGILTHPYLLSAFAYHDNTSPIHRGVFLTRNIVGRQLKPPPVAVAFENNDFAPDLTMREKVTELTRDQACLSCHEVINPLGFALENFDAVGRWRSSENDKPIDTRSDYTSSEGTKFKIDSARDIANFAVESPIAHRAFIRQLFQHLVQQNPAAYDPELLDTLRQSFVAKNFHIRKLIVRIATESAMHVSKQPALPNHYSSHVRELKP